jgi:hypothetical protein
MSEDERRLQLLQLLFFKRRCQLQALQTATGMAPAELRALLDELQACGVTTATDGIHALTPPGDEARRQRIAAERDARPAGQLEQLYERFHEHNTELKQIITSWQMRDVDGALVINDHADALYDRRVRGALAALNARFRPLLEQLVALHARWAMYPRRFDAALAALEHDPRYLASPLLDSYHPVWFELHEELIEAQGIDRVTEERG